MRSALFAQIPDYALGRMLLHRPRSYAQLGYHIFNIADAFLEHEVEETSMLKLLTRLLQLMAR